MGITGIGIGALLALAIRTLIVLVTLVAALRILGKRQAGEMRTLDILVVLVVANAVQNAMTKSDGHLAVGLVAAGTLILAGWLSGIVLQRMPALETRLLGAPLVLVRRGQILRKNLQREGLTENDLMVAVRMRGLSDISKAKLAVLEMDGSISVVQSDDEEQS